MMSNRRLRTISGWLICSLLLCLTLPAISQDRLDAGVLANPDFWAPADRQAIAAFVDRQVAAIQSGDEVAMNEGRTNLTDPPRTPGASERFLNQFSELVCEEVAPLMDSDVLKVRINSMVVCMSLPHPNGLAAIQKGLADESAGVRYPAARALEGLLSSGQLDAAQTVEVLDLIQELIVAESDIYVVQPLFEAMLAAPDNNEKVLEVLNQRLSSHVDEPDASFVPAGTALQAVYSRLITAPQRPVDDVRELARASARHLLLAATQLEAGEVPDQIKAGHLEAIRVSAVALEFAFQELQSSQLAPLSPAGALRTEKWDAIVRIGENWVEVLKTDPFNYTDADLDITAAAPQAAAQ
ncbi:putative transcriptional regulator [Algisphaera agarilytica]|uniref:Putative transcriptional regulator n=2 Tax=Algisphaera agarilytica TaxID=1385975 RepID=A0A7X0H8G8_9BACT|nr:putative transcriptional regulator [Algisphaera agarilytica]